MGYDWAWGMSDRAVEAINKGLMTPWRVCTYLRHFGFELTAKIVKEYFDYDEWHHTSKHFNITYYFSRESVLSVLSELEARRALKELAKKSAAEKKSSKKVFGNCEWLVWSGSHNYPHATKRTAEGVFAIVKGDWYIVTLPDGSILRKNINTNGFLFKEVE
mgnify:CR=1 FL=1